MWVARLSANATEFSLPEPIVEPTWEFAGCPHDGPSLCETSTGMHVAWMDAHEGLERVYIRTLGSKSPPVAVGNPVSPKITQGHPQLVARHDELLLVWDENLPASDSRQASDEHEGTNAAQLPAARPAGHAHAKPPEAASGGRVICLVTSADGGQTFSNPLTVAPIDDHFQTRPRVAVSPSGSIVVCWMELSASGKDVVATTLPKAATKNTSLVTMRGTSHE